MTQQMIHCSTSDARTLAKFGHDVYAKLDGDFNHVGFYILGDKDIAMKRRHTSGGRRVSRGHIPSTSMLKLTGTTPSFTMRGTRLENCFIATRDLLVTKKYEGVIERGKLEKYLCSRFKIDSNYMSATVSQLIYVKKALEVAVEKE